jgi:sulfotransferase
LAATKRAWDKSLDVQSQIDAEKELYFSRFANVLRGIIEAWYKEIDAEVIFDKSRPWNAQYLLLKRLYSQPKMIMPVRDLRSVFASIEKHYLDSMLYGSLLKQTLQNKLKEVFSVKGVIGNHLMYIIDLHERGLLPELFVIKFEVLTREPKETLDRLYEYLGEEKYDHDFDNVVRMTQEDDSVYRYHYPHRGEGKITPAKAKDWQDIIPDKVAGLIRQQHDLFFKVFGYE